MSTPRLLVISFSDIPSDARVLRQVRLFADMYDVETCGYGDGPVEATRHFSISPDNPVWQYDRPSLILRQYRRAYWKNAAIKAAHEKLKHEKFDLIIANDVDSVGLALALKPRYGVHADLHEYAPRQKEEMRRWKLLVAPFVSWMCRSFVARANSVTTVAQGIAREYQRQFGFSAQVVTNAAKYVDLPVREVKTPIRLVHSGACRRGRGIEEMMQAVETTSVDSRLDLFLTPNDGPYLEQIRAWANQMTRVTIHDPVPYDQLVRVLNDYDVGVHILPPVSFNNAMALPNKFFDYVQARLGIVVGPSPEMAAVLQQHELGAVAPGFSSQDLRRSLDSLDRHTVGRWKSNSDAAARELSSETQTSVWAAAVEQIMSGVD